MSDGLYYWTKDGKYIVDDQGYFILCSKCPCHTQTSSSSRSSSSRSSSVTPVNCLVGYKNHSVKVTFMYCPSTSNKATITFKAGIGPEFGDVSVENYVIVNNDNTVTVLYYADAGWTANMTFNFNGAFINGVSDYMGSGAIIYPQTTTDCTNLQNGYVGVNPTYKKVVCRS